MGQRRMVGPGHGHGGQRPCVPGGVTHTVVEGGQGEEGGDSDGDGDGDSGGWIYIYIYIYVRESERHTEVIIIIIIIMMVDVTPGLLPPLSRICSDVYATA